MTTLTEVSNLQLKLINIIKTDGIKKLEDLKIRLVY